MFTGEINMSYHCEIKEQTAQHTLAIRTRTSIGNLPVVLGKTFGEIAGYLGEMGQCPAGAPYVAYHNMDMNDLDLEIGFPVAKEMPGKGDIKASMIPGGKVATCMYQGPYEEMCVPYEALTKLVTESGYQATGIAYETYLNSPMDTQPSELQTLIMFPLKSA